MNEGVRAKGETVGDSRPDTAPREILVPGGHGAAFVAKAGQMFEIVHDDVGRNDIITSMCDDRRYRLDYAAEGHRSCRTNFAEALEPWGIAEWQIPDPFNFFQNAPIHPDRTFGNEIPTGRPGDKLVLRTLLDAIVAVSACPQDLNPCNGFHPSPLLVRVLDLSADAS